MLNEFKLQTDYFVILKEIDLYNLLVRQQTSSLGQCSATAGHLVVTPKDFSRRLSKEVLTSK